MAKGKRRQTADNDQFEDEGAMRKELREMMYHKGAQQQHLRFVCNHKLLDEFWNKHRVEKITAFRKYEIDVIRIIRERFLRVLSIAIFTEWTDLIRFDPVFVKEDLDDSSLFFDERQLNGMVTGVDNFVAQQYMFKPEIIIQTQQAHIQAVPAISRLPFIDEPAILGKGGYGSVSRRQIAPYCLNSNSEEYGSTSNSGIVAVAVKEFPTNKSEQDFQREVDNLNFMKESLREQKCVTRHIAALVHGSKFMIIMPLANHYNLEVFFCEGMQLLKNTEESERRYDFGDKFPSIRTDGDLHKAVVKQVFQLADALQWLHHDLGDFEKQNRYLAHMDLKPENILIYGNPQNETTPVGQWMVTDFGISAFYKASNKPIQEAPTIRDVTSRLTPYAVRGRGPYQPPEIGLESKKEEADSGLRDRHSLDYRQCDVWSFGCVLSDVLAFALNRSQGVLDLRKARDQDGNDNFYKFVEKVEAMANISASNTKLKEGFVNWGDQIRESNAGSWVLGYLDILFKHSIVPCPSDRKRIKSIKDRLGELYPVSSPPNSNILTNQEGLDITPIQGPHEKHVKDSQEHPALPNTHMEGLGGARNVQTASLPNAMSTVPSRAFIRQPQDSPSQSSSSITMDRKSLVNGVTGGPPFVLVQSQKISADDHQLQIVDGEIICSSIPVPLDKKASVKAVALDSTGERIAILCEAEVVIFPTTLPKSSDQKSLHIPTGVKWNRVRIAHPGLAIFGAISSGEIMAELYDLQTLGKPKSLDGAYRGDALFDIRLTATGIVACAYADHAILYFSQSNDPYELSMEAPGATISRMAFNADGQKLFFWLEGHAADYVRIFEIDPLNKSAHGPPSLRFGKEGMLRNPSRDNLSNIWPSAGSAFCVIHQKNGAFIAQALPSQNPSGYQKSRDALPRRVIEVKAAVAGLICNNKLLLCLEDHGRLRHKQLSSYTINLTTSGEWELVSERHPHSKLDRDIDTSAGMAKHVSSDRVELILYSTKKKILRYTLPTS